MAKKKKIKKERLNKVSAGVTKGTGALPRDVVRGDVVEVRRIAVGPANQRVEIVPQVKPRTR